VLRFRAGAGVYDWGGSVYRVEAGRTLLGLTHGRADHVPESPDAVDVGDRIADAIRQIGAKVGLRGAKASDDKHKKSSVSVGLRANAITFLSEVLADDAAPIPVTFERDDAKTKKEEPEKRAQTVLSDSITVTVGKSKLLLKGKVRMAELDKLQASTGLDPQDEHRYEPEPWAAWRASAHYAPFKPKKGIHLRYLLGTGSGLAILCTPKWPLAWQVLSWEEGAKEESILQAFHLLNVHATRRLHLSGIDYVSVQGEGNLEANWESIETTIDRKIVDVDGPEYGPELIAFGLALGSLEPRNETLNLARSIQHKPKLLAMVPWGEAGFLMSLFLCMFLVLNDYSRSLELQLAKSKAANAEAVWAKGVPQAKLQAEAQLLKNHVNPLEKYLERDLYFSRAMSAIAQALPDSTWLDSINGGDLIWEKNPNKALGQKYLLVQAGAPSARRGLAPPEIDHAVHNLEDNAYLQTILPRVKLTDVNWRQQSGQGYTVFSMLALPKE